MIQKYINRGMTGVVINNRDQVSVLVEPGDEVELTKDQAESFNDYKGKKVFTKKEKKNGTDKTNKRD